MSLVRPLLALAFVLHASAAASTPAGFRVLKVEPGLNALNVPRETGVTVVFSAPVDLATLTPEDFSVFGHWSALTPGAIVASADRTRVTFVPDLPFSAGESVSVALSKNVQSAGGAPLREGFAWSFWVDSRPSNGNYTHTSTLSPGAVPYGAYGGDLDADEDLDLAIPNEVSFNLAVYLNNGTGTFTGPQTYALGQQSSPNEAADFDLDGRLDIAVSNIATDDVSVLFGNGDGTFDPQVRYTVGDQPRGLAVLDFDADGDSDLVAANRQSGSNGDLSLLRNNGTGVFLPEVRLQASISGETGVAACDMDRDGITDLCVIGFSGNNVRVMLGDGNGSFVPGDVASVGAAPWMVTVGDLDGDGWCDVACALAGGDAAAIVRNDGSGGLGTVTTYPAANFLIAVDLGDLEGDGDLDLTTCSYSSGDFDLFKNDGAGNFTHYLTLQPAAGQAASCTVLHDFDGDGDVDITAIDEVADRVFLYRRDG